MPHHIRTTCGTPFAVTSFDTEYLFVKESVFPTTVAVLRGAGHTVEVPEGGR